MSRGRCLGWALRCQALSSACHSRPLSAAWLHNFLMARAGCVCGLLCERMPLIADKAPPLQIDSPWVASIGVGSQRLSP